MAGSMVLLQLGAMSLIYAVARNLVDARCTLKVTSSTVFILLQSLFKWFLIFLKQQNEYNLITQQICQTHHLHFTD